MLLAAAVAWAGALASAGPAQTGPAPTVAQLWERCRETLPPFSYTVVKDEVVASDTDPGRRLRRVEVRFASQTVGQWERRMTHTGVLHIPVGFGSAVDPARKGKVVVIAGAYGDTTILDNYGEPIAARMGYPTMVLPIPGEYDGHDGESSWVYFLRAQLADTGYPVEHQYFRFGYSLSHGPGRLRRRPGQPKVVGVIGGHSKRAPAAFNAAAMDPERVAGVVYMGMESTFAAYEGKAWQGLSPAAGQELVRCPVLYLGATNEDGYEMFNITKLQAKIAGPGRSRSSPTTGTPACSEIQILDWQMWIAHVFEGRPLTRIGDLSWAERCRGDRLPGPHRVAQQDHQAKVWYVYCDDVPYWRDLMWYPVYLQKAGDLYEAFLPG